jgi:hypothetical protein
VSEDSGWCALRGCLRLGVVRMTAREIATGKKVDLYVCPEDARKIRAGDRVIARTAGDEEGVQL